MIGAQDPAAPVQGILVQVAGIGVAAHLPERAERVGAAPVESAPRLARQRFEGGMSDFLSVLQAERDALAAEDSLAQGRTQTATSLIAVYKALGGGWMTP